MIDLSDSPSETAKEGPSKAYYPTLRFNGDKLSALGLGKASLGDEFEITLKLKATNLSDNGSAFDIIGATGKASASESEDEEKPKDKPKRETREPDKGPKIVKPPMDDDDEDGD